MIYLAMDIPKIGHVVKEIKYELVNIRYRVIRNIKLQLVFHFFVQETLPFLFRKGHYIVHCC